MNDSDPMRTGPMRELHGCECGDALDIDPERVSVTAEVADGTRVTLTGVPCGLCANCNAPFFRPRVADAIRSIRGLFQRPRLGHIERSYRDMVKRYWAH